MRRDAPIEVGRQEAHRSPAGWRVEATVDGRPVWFESPDAVLDPAPEAFGSAVLPVAAAHEAALALAARPDALFLANARRLLEVTREWWGRPRDPRAILAGLEPATGRADQGQEADGGPEAGGEPGPDGEPGAGARGAGLCFSGGVDSFYCLLRGDARIDVLVFVHGYDVPLADETRARAAEASLRDVAAGMGARPVLIRTNLRLHPLWRGWRPRRWRRARRAVREAAGWPRVHGGALAAAGHLLRRSLRELRIAASYPLEFDRPYGSHWRLDPLWSSAALRVVHAGAERWRTQKLLAIIDEPLVRRHLRVCWRNLAPTGNCGRCEKCVRTMLILEGAGRLDRFPVFPAPAGLADALDRLLPLDPDLLPVYRTFLDTGLSRAARAATLRLLERGGRRPSGGRRLRFRDGMRRADL
jgi:hypothetical protein